MLYLDFGPLRHSSAIAKTLLRATAYMLLAGIVMAGLLQTGAAAVGAYSDVAVQGEEMTEAEFGELIEAMLFWLIGLLAPLPSSASKLPRWQGCRREASAVRVQRTTRVLKATLFIDPVRLGSRDALH